jgi:hypothetical protein
VTYPSGVTILTKPDPVLSASYAGLQTGACEVPTCFLDVGDLRTPAGEALTLDVPLSEHFTLRDLVQTEVDAKFSTSVLVVAPFVEKLEAMRNAAGTTPTINSGFRSPLHQAAVCKSICGCAQCVSNGSGGNRCGGGGGTVTCARNSRHMWGAAADLALSFASASRTAGFPFVFQEFGGSGPHLHVDLKDCH